MPCARRPGRPRLFDDHREAVLFPRLEFFRVSSFDERAAVEAAVRTWQARQRGERKGGNPDAAKAKIKFDRQIVAIAAVEGAIAVYSDDADVIAYAREAGMEGYRLADISLPPEDEQADLQFDPPDEG